MVTKPVQVVGAPAYVVPSKWDIIPIHTSDVASYKRCRRYWDWTSPTRNNLRRRVSVHGINMALWFGTGIHYAMEMKYDPIVSRDPIEAFKTWYELQVNGGEITATELEDEWYARTYDINPIHDPKRDVYMLHGLREMLPAWEVVEEDFQEHYDLGIGMLTFYQDWSERNDDFVTVAAESTYSIPLGFEAIDRRENSPNYGKKLEVHARGKRDSIVYYPEFEKFGINDYKTAVRIDDAYFKKLEKDEQCSNYLWATIQEAKLYDLPWKDAIIDRVLYTALRKNFPKPPTILEKSGFPSLDKQKEGTTAEMFKAVIMGNENFEHWFRNNEKAQAYYNYLCLQGDDLFVIRTPTYRNEHEVRNTGIHLREIAEEMLADPKIYPNPTGEFRCIECAFRAPCISADDGSDWQGMLADGYERNLDR